MTKQAPGDEINLPAVATSLSGILRFILVRNKTERPLCIVGHGRGDSEATPRSVTPTPQLSLDQSVDTPRRASEGVMVGGRGSSLTVHASRPIARKLIATVVGLTDRPANPPLSRQLSARRLEMFVSFF